MDLERSFPDRRQEAKKTDYIRELEALERTARHIAPENNIPLNLPSSEEGVAVSKRLSTAGLETNVIPSEWVALGDAMIYRPGLGTARIGSYNGEPVIAALYAVPGAQKHVTVICRVPDTVAAPMDIACGIYWKLINHVTAVRVAIHEGIDAFRSVKNEPIKWFEDARLHAAVADTKEAIIKPLADSEAALRKTSRELTSTQAQVNDLLGSLRTAQAHRKAAEERLNIPPFVGALAIIGGGIVGTTILMALWLAWQNVHTMFFKGGI